MRKTRIGSSQRRGFLMVTAGELEHRTRASARSTKVTPKRIAVQRRRAEALILRGQGLTYARIANALGYSSAGEARKQVLIAFDGIVDEPAQELRTLQLERLNSLLTVAWKVTTEPTASPAAQLRAINSAMGIIDQISNLTGLVSARPHTTSSIRPPVMSAAIKTDIS